MWAWRPDLKLCTDRAGRRPVMAMHSHSALKQDGHQTVLQSGHSQSDRMTSVRAAVMYERVEERGEHGEHMAIPDQDRCLGRTCRRLARGPGAYRAPPSSSCLAHTQPSL